MSPVEQDGQGRKRLTPLASFRQPEGRSGIVAVHATHHRWWPISCHSAGTHQHDRRTRSAPFAWHPLQHHAVCQRFPGSPGCGQSFYILGLSAPAHSSSWQKESAGHESVRSLPGQNSRRPDIYRQRPSWAWVWHRWDTNQQTIMKKTMKNKTSGWFWSGTRQNAFCETE